MQDKLIIVMVGLPARGKSYITKKISNYLNWLNINNKIFNVGNKRRLQLLQCEEQNADFFNPNQSKNVAIRDQLAMSTLDDLLDWLNMSDDCPVGIFDATNSTIKRRELIKERISKRMQGQNYNVLFLESICNDLDIVENNIKLKLNGPDYKDVEDKFEALDDFKKRLQNYESIYETVESRECQDYVQCIKIVNIHNLKSYNIFGVYSLMLQGFLSNYNTCKKKIWLSINNIDSSKFIPLIINSSNFLKIMSEEAESNHHKLIPKSSTLDQIHDLILDLESSNSDVLIQTTDQFLINGLFKYFKPLQKFNQSSSTSSNIDLNYEIICINPDHYQTDFTKIDIRELYPLEMTRSNSNGSNTSEIYTPINVDGLDQFNYQNLLEVNEKLELLK